MEKVKLLDNEKMKTEKAFHDFLPKSIVKELKQKRVCYHMYYFHVTNTNSYFCVHQVLAENFDFVSIFFADIVDFSALTANCTPNEVKSEVYYLYVRWNYGYL